MPDIQLKANYMPKRQVWTKAEIAFLMKYYPRYKEGSERWTAHVIRGNLGNRTMSALSKKYWSLTGRTGKFENRNQLKFDFMKTFVK